MNKIEVSGLDFFYGTFRALSRISINIEVNRITAKGKFLAMLLMFQCGAGKSIVLGHESV